MKYFKRSVYTFLFPFLLTAISIGGLLLLPHCASAGNLRPSIAVESMRLEIPLSGNLSASRPGGENSLSGVRALKSGRQDHFRITPESELTLSEDRLVIVALDGEDKALYRESVVNPALIRSESFGQNGEATAPGKTVQLDHKLIADLPALPGIQKVIIYQPRWNGKAFELDALRIVDLKKALNAPQLKSRSLSSVTPPVVGRAKLLDNGPSDRKVDVVFIGDGYTASQMKKWHTDANVMMGKLFQIDPFKKYKNYFNLHRLDIVSKQSGASYKGKETVNTALNSYFNCGGTPRLLCADFSKARRVLNSALNKNQQDMVVIIVNHKRYGGAGGGIATTSLGGGVRVLVHELGHSFAGFADEYSYGRTDCNPRREPYAPNISIESSPQKVKWRNIPDTGVFEGANYCKKNYYRPYKNSMMRSLGQWGELHMRVWDRKIKAIADDDVRRKKPEPVVEPDIPDPTDEPVIPEPDKVKTVKRYLLVSKHQDLALSGDYRGVFAVKKSVTNSQTWILTKAKGNYYYVHLSTGNSYLSAPNGFSPRMSANKGGSEALWNLQEHGGGYYVLRLKRNKRVLTLSPSRSGTAFKTIVWTWRGGANQLWRLVPLHDK